MDKTDFYAVAIDETRYYQIEATDATHIECILGVYVYDASERTYCCELTPSHWLEPVYVAVHCKLDTPDDVRERIQEKYEFAGTLEGFYMHASKVAGLPLRKHYGEGESIDEVREHYQGNCPW